MKLNLTIENITLEDLGKIQATLGGEVISVSSEPLPIFDTAPVEDVEGQVDAQGIPWDARIHSSSKKKTAAGVWNKRKNVSEEEYIAVVKELTSPVVEAPVAPAPVVVAPVIPPLPAPTPAPVVAPVIPPLPAPVAPAPVQTGLPQLVGRIQVAVAGGKFTQEAVNQMIAWVNTTVGIQATSLVDFASNPAALEAANSYLQQVGA